MTSQRCGRKTPRHLFVGNGLTLNSTKLHCKLCITLTASNIVKVSPLKTPLDLNSVGLKPFINSSIFDKYHESFRCYQLPLLHLARVPLHKPTASDGYNRSKCHRWSRRPPADVTNEVDWICWFTSCENEKMSFPWKKNNGFEDDPFKILSDGCIFPFSRGQS